MKERRAKAPARKPQPNFAVVRALSRIFAEEFLKRRQSRARLLHSGTARMRHLVPHPREVGKLTRCGFMLPRSDRRFSDQRIVFATL